MRFISKTDQAKILRKSMNVVDLAVIDTLLMTDYEAKVAAGILEHLRKQTLYTTRDQLSFCSLVQSVCGDNV